MVKFTQKPTACHAALDEPPPVLSGVPVILVAAAALIDCDGRVLVAQRPQGKSMAGLWEFPGGKIDEGETPEYALMRELREELALETRPGCFYPVGFASHSYENFHLLMPLFSCRVWAGDPVPQEGQQLKWLKPVDLFDIEMPPADIPLIDALIRAV